ncbi:MAG: hypothetical protein JJT89_02635 [Nitriliruptoraceae bacterium]|nr:hypothetical protein [Nitriliruptoraceae bacterium]
MSLPEVERPREMLLDTLVYDDSMVWGLSRAGESFSRIETDVLLEEVRPLIAAGWMRLRHAEPGATEFRDVPAEQIDVMEAAMEDTISAARVRELVVAREGVALDEVVGPVVARGWVAVARGGEPLGTGPQVADLADAWVVDEHDDSSAFVTTDEGRRWFRDNISDAT